MKKISTIVQQGEEYEFVDSFCRKRVNKLLRDVAKLLKFHKMNEKTKKLHSKNKKSISSVNNEQEFQIINSKIQNLEYSKAQSNANLKNTFDVVQQQLDICKDEIQHIKTTFIETCVNKINLTVDVAKTLPIMFYMPSNDDYFTYLINYNIVDRQTLKTYSLTYFIQNSSDKENYSIKVKKIFGELDIEFFYCFKSPFMYILSKPKGIEEFYVHQSVTILDGRMCQFTYSDELPKLKLTKIKSELDELEKLKKYTEKKFRELNKKINQEN